MMTIEFQGLDKFQGYMSDVSERLSDARIANLAVAQKAWKDVMEHFKNEEGPDGKWAPLNVSWTLAARRKGKGTGSDKILQDNGDLRRSIQFRSTKTDAEVYTGLVYAGTHQYGRKMTIRKRTITIPKRPFMWLSDKMKSRLGSIYVNYYVRGRAVE